MVNLDIGLIVADLLSKKNIVLVVLPPESYNDSLLSFIKKTDDKNTCYLAFGESCESLMRGFEQRGIKSEGIFFLDCISKQEGLDTGEKKHAFLDSPTDLVEIQEAAKLALGKNFTYFVLDSLNFLYLHNSDKEREAINFVQKLVDEIRRTNTKAVFFASDIEEHAPFVKEISMLVDKTLNLSESKIDTS